MIKSKIFASSNETIKGEFNISYYIVEKDPGFLKWLGRLLEEVMDIGHAESKVEFVHQSVYDDNDEFIREDVYQKNIKKMIDVHESYENGGERIDLFYGHERVFIMFRKSRGARERLGSFLVKTKDWIKAKEVTRLPLPSYAGKKVSGP